MSILRKGDTGEEVKKLQTALNWAGCTLTVDGVFGSDTYIYALGVLQMTFSMCMRSLIDLS